ncbi:MAG: sodium/proline symporter [Alphaproteobacteria bacterium]|nr:sodium/proline symporter [Alphaproteobacteria bacterium]
MDTDRRGALVSGILAGFLASLLLFVAIGAWSTTRAGGGDDDYLLAGRSVPAWLAALSSVATNNSGFMFVGMIGFTYRGGVHTVWMAVAWVLGDLAAWLWVHPRVRALSGATDALSVPTLLAERDHTLVVRTAALLTVLFLGGYAAAQLQAGSLALEQLFGWPAWAGAVIGAVIVLVYCVAGGLRASIWTDAAQAGVMMLAMLLLLGVAAARVGGPLALHDALAAQDPALVDWFPSSSSAGFPLWVLGFLAGGFGAIGQPHILVRTMSVSSVAEVARARPIYFAWFVPFYVMGVLVALYARVLLPELGGAGAAVRATEGALPALASLLLPGVLVGVVLAGLFAATMSTADSQILSCSAALTEDLVPRDAPWRPSPKLATLAVTAVALAVALTAEGGVFALVLRAWGILGAALGPLLLVRVAGGRPPQSLALAMMAAGVGVVLTWPLLPGTGDVYALLPGMVAPLLLYAVARGGSPVATRIE